MVSEYEREPSGEADLNGDTAENPLEDTGESAPEDQSADGNGASASEAADGDPAAPDVETILAERDRLEAELAAVTAERQELVGRLQRLQAEFDNFRRRTARESEALRKRASEDLVDRLLPVVDNLERAVEAVGERKAESALAQGVQLVVKQFQSLLADEGLERISAVGEPFDPDLHEAVDRVPASDGIPPGHVVEELQRGYKLAGRLLRPAKVRVASEDPAAVTGEESCTGRDAE